MKFSVLREQVKYKICPIFLFIKRFTRIITQTAPPTEDYLGIRNLRNLSYELYLHFIYVSWNPREYTLAY